MLAWLKLRLIFSRQAGYEPQVLGSWVGTSDQGQERSLGVAEDPYLRVDQEGESPRDDAPGNGTGRHHPGQTTDSPLGSDREGDDRLAGRRHVTDIFTMSRGGNLGRAVESQVLGEAEEFHECDEPRVLNLLGQRQGEPLAVATQFRTGSSSRI